MAAETIVSTVLQQLASIIGREVEQEVRLVVGVRKEIKKLTNNFQAIQAVLVDAEQRQVKESTVTVWLDKLKDAAYDMDDVLDEWSTAILKLQIEGAENAPIPKKKVPFMFTFPCFCFRQVALRHDIGRDELRNNLVSKLLNESKERTSLPVISIVGVGGIGKTTLAQLAYNDVEIRSKFENRIWVCVSDPFDEVRIARAIIEGLGGQANTLVEFQSLLECISKTIENKKFLHKKFLLILDDVWNEDYDKWGPLYNCLQSGLHNGSKIVVTTRKEKVARMMKSIDVINIGVLPVNASWLLFKQLAFCDRSQEECERLENIGREIVDKCKGLPLAIKSVGSLLRFKKTRDQWQRILDSELWKLEELEGLFPPLMLSYNDLSFRVKQCFSYCAIYPKDYEMKKDELIKLWMAQGYLGLEQNEEMEIIGEECFDTLAMHSFFQEFRKDEYGNIVECKMHDIVHDFAQFLVKNECFTVEIENSEELSSTISFEKVRHLTLILRWLNCINICSVPKLRSLLLIMNYNPRARCSFPSNAFDKLTCLRALSLRLSGVNIIPSEIGKLLHLRYLDLSGLGIKELPETLCCLYNMQSLNLSECMHLVKLPQGMGKLINLRHLLTAGATDLSYMPKGIERLTCLQTLDTFVVGSDAHGMGVGSLECLKNLNKLRGNLSLYGLKNVVDEAEAKNAQLMNKKNMAGLELIFDAARDIALVEESRKDSAVLEALQPPPTLERLFIMGCRSVTLSPHWMAGLTQLKLLTLTYCYECEHLPPLGELPQLESLEIGFLESVKRVANEFLGRENMYTSSSVILFPKLKTFKIRSMDNWQDWDYETAGDIKIMPCLSVLSIRNCRKLKQLPDHIFHASSRLRLKLLNSPIVEQLFFDGKMSGENSPAVSITRLSSAVYCTRQ